MKKKELTTVDFNQYYGVYLDTLDDDAILKEQLVKGYENFPKFIASIANEKMNYAYEEGKWTIAQVLLHIIDTERIFQYRAFRFSRRDKTPLMGFDQDDYIIKDDPRLNKEYLINSYKTVRASSIDVFKTLDDEVLQYTGEASGLQWTVASIGFVICGHQRHHRNIIRERYL